MAGASQHGSGSAHQLGATPREAAFYPGTYNPKKVPIVSFFNTLRGGATFPHGTANSPIIHPSTLRVQRFNGEKLAKWGFTWAAWGFTASMAGLWLVSLLPKFQTGVLQHVPGLSWYYEDKTPESDKWL